MMDRTDPFVLHPCRNDRSCLVLPAQLIKFLDHMGCNYKIVNFDDAISACTTTTTPTTITAAVTKSQRKDEESGNAPGKHSDPNKKNACT